MRSLILITSFLLFCHLSLSAQELNQIDGQGRKQGKWMKTYQNGVVRYEGQFRNNQPYGEFKYYFEDANVQAVTIFSDDGVIGHTITFHENGSPMATGKYVNQKKDSTWLYYSDIDGALLAEENYSRGKLNGLSTTYYPASETLAETIGYQDGIKHGVFKKYFPDGAIMIDGSYKNNQFDGDYTVYYSDGIIEVKGKYMEGKKIGEWEYFDETGKQITEEEYQNVYKTIEKQ